jgi:N-acetylglutamate synthase-like GNAT family acetyltransferase
MPLEPDAATRRNRARIRPMRADDLDAADRVMRLAFGTIRGLPDPSTAFDDRDLLRTRFRAAPGGAWVAEAGSEVVGSVLAAQWGSFGFFGPLTVHPELWDRGIGSQLLRPVLGAFEEWELAHAGLFTFADSPKHLGLYEKHGFRPGSLTYVLSKESDATTRSPYELVAHTRAGGLAAVLDEIRGVTELVFPGLDVGREVVAVDELQIGDTLLVRREGTLEGIAVCHRGAGSEAGSDTCYVKFAAVRPGTTAGARFEHLVGACESYAADLRLGRLVVGVDTGRTDAHRRLLARGFREQQAGLAMWLRPTGPHFGAPDYVICDLR